MCVFIAISTIEKKLVNRALGDIVFPTALPPPPPYSAPLAVECRESNKTRVRGIVILALDRDGHSEGQVCRRETVIFD